MGDLLRKKLAPLTDEAWEEIEQTAVQVLKANLSGRGVVDFKGPHGWDLAAVNVGRLDIPKEQKVKGVYWGARKVQPLVEIRVPFKLKQAEVDDISRGAREADLSPLEEAAQKMACFEETAIYSGFAEGNIQGLVQASAHKPITFDLESDKFVKAVAGGIQLFHEQAIGGPYALILGTKSYGALLQTARSGYPVYKAVNNLLADGKIFWTPALKGGVLASTRGGDFELTVGQDISIGYCAHDRDEIELYLTESFTFRVLEPAAAVELKIK
jgi:uncharacterized linocin/CFP29 family protein